MCIACQMTKAMDIQNMQFLLLLHGNSGYVNALQCYVYTYISSLVTFIPLCKWNSAVEKSVEQNAF